MLSAAQVVLSVMLRYLYFLLLFNLRKATMQNGTSENTKPT